MANTNYHSQPTRNYGQPAPAPPAAREAAFSNIFGAPPPAGRSQTMSSASGAQMAGERAATMSAQQNYMGHAGGGQAQQQQRGPSSQGRNMSGGYPQMPQQFQPQPQPQQHAQQPQPHTQAQQQTYQNNPPHQQQQQQQPPYTNGLQQQQNPSPQRRPAPPPQALPQPIRPDRVPYNQPQRLDSRGQPVPGSGQYQRSFTQRPYPTPGTGGAGAGPGMAGNGMAMAGNGMAMTAGDGYRTQSLATNPRPIYQGPQGGVGGREGYGAGGGGVGGGGGGVGGMGAPANAFRQQPYMNHLARTTAQGRVVPERTGDERTMSMSSYSRDAGDFGGQQIQGSGRVIPGRVAQVQHDMEGLAQGAGRTMTMEGLGRTGTMDSNATRTMDSSSDIFHNHGGNAGNGNQRLPNGPQLNGRMPSGSSQTTIAGGGGGGGGSRTMSMASTVVGASLSDSSHVAVSGARPSVSGGGGAAQRSISQSTAASTMVAQKRPSLVYGALLSNVAAAFRERVPLAEKEKDGLVYKNAFSGYEAVELIAYIIRTSDRNLALLLGRSLDAQKFFHEVAYAHRLRDSPAEVYQFKETPMNDVGSVSSSLSMDGQVNGVFTLLTECYSPTCNRDNLCYSIACPRRLEQQQRLNMKVTPGLKRETSRGSLHEEAESNEQQLWINTVSKEVSDSVTDREKKRQEVISELLYTERDFVKDLEYLRDFWIKPLRTPEISPIPEHRREKFIRTVFSNCQEVHSVNARLAQALTRRQQQSPVVRNVGDVFLEFVPLFTPFIKYGANQLFGKFEFEKEKSSNPAFARFVEETERLKESRKLELNGYLTKPTTRLARYPLFLDNVLKFAEEGSPDRQDLPRVIEGIRGVLSRVNEESGKAENQWNLMNLNSVLKWGNIPHMDLKLMEEARVLVFKSNLKKTAQSESADVSAYLFDHAVLLVRVKMVNKREEMKVYRKPIPLELLQIREMESVLPKGAGGMVKRPSSSMIPGVVGRATQSSLGTTMMGGKGGGGAEQQGYPITFKGLGKGGYELTLYCVSQSQREKWMEHIAAQKERLGERHRIFSMSKLCEGFFTQTVRINCCRPIDGGRKLVIGTDFGVFVSERKKDGGGVVAKPRKLLEARFVTQLEVLEQHSILVVLADKAVYTYPLEALDPEESPNSPAKKGKRICHANYINAGMCNGQTLLCCVKSSSLSSTVKVFEPMERTAAGKKKSGFAKMLASGQEVLRPYKEFYIPMESNSIHFLRSKLCVGGAKGFEIVSLETLETQSLLDQADTSLDFVSRRSEASVKPIYIERNTSEFLLCYNDFSFYVNKNGWRARGDWKILWEGRPEAFATWGEKYILAFEPEFIEVRGSESGGLVCILTLRGVRFLHQSTREILFAYEDENGEDVIASLDFWGKS
ncbi:RHO1 GDP-GTP exchange protein 2 [Elasticomyces elasticus]|nr:RHO1 GDP-GTP exchange protein 2 [Elasticomyces elasticus]KAK5767952.1 RHO1 GDP-GTP exchange protein 2 [Elasticomyces elasticus]